MPVQWAVIVANPASYGFCHQLGHPPVKGAVIAVVQIFGCIRSGGGWLLVKALCEPAKCQAMRHERPRWGWFCKIAMTGSLA